MGLLPGVGTAEMLIVGIVALLLFGKRLPEVAMNAGKSLAQLKKGMAGFQDEFRSVTREAERASGINSARESWSSPDPTPTPVNEPSERPEPVSSTDSEEDFTAPKFDLE